MILKNAQQGDSITIGVNLIDYETYRLESFKIYLGGVEYPCTISSNIVKCEISSNITSTFFGKKTLVFWIDDSVFGVKNFIIGDIIFGTLSTSTNESINEGFDVLVPITFTDTAIVIGDVLYDYFRGESAFDVWLQNGNEGKTYEDYIAFLQQPATEAALLANIATENANEATENAVIATQNAIAATDSLLSNIISLEIRDDLCLWLVTPDTYDGVTFRIENGNLIATI